MEQNLRIFLGRDTGTMTSTELMDIAEQLRKVFAGMQQPTPKAQFHRQKTLSQLHFPGPPILQGMCAYYLLVPRL